MAQPAQTDLFGDSGLLGAGAGVAAKAEAAAAPAPVAAAKVGPKSVTLIDASGFIFRAYHALPPLTTSKGVPTHAVLGFARMLLKLLRERAPTHVALCFDKDSRRGRLAIDPNYKANREATPDDLLKQFETIRQVAEVLQLPIIEMAGWEADDVIATLVKKARAQGFHVRVVTSDKDFLQILADDVELFDPVKDAPITAADAEGKYGIKPSQMRDYLALVGDAIDNVPKVPGIGPKTAAELLTKFGDVESLLKRLPEVGKPKVREALQQNEESLRRAYQLVSFKDDLPLDVDIEALKRRDIHQAAARALFTQLEFFRLISEMPSAPATPLVQQPTIVADAEALAALADKIRHSQVVALTPAFEGEAHSAALRGLGVAFDGADVRYVDLRSLTSDAVHSALAQPLASAKVHAHDGKALMHLLHSVGIELERVDTDIALLSYLLNPSRREHALADLARERLRTELPLWPEAGRSKLPFEQLSTEQCATQFGAAADAVARLSAELWEEAEGVGLAALARQLELPLIPVLTRMERAGVAVDLSALSEISAYVDEQCQSLLQAVYRHAGREFNVGSPPQLAQVLYEELKLPVLKRNKTGPSTDHEVLEKLADLHPLPNAISEYRNVAKLKSTYLDTLPSLVGADGRIRTTFGQTMAATGRLSSSNPNLQNIPIRTELGRRIRRAFVAQPGWQLVSADYSQVELRILAHVSEDEGLIAAFREDADVHARTAAEVFGVGVGDVTDEQRRAAKMVNYGIAYGLSPHGLSTRLNVPIEEAKSIIDRYFARFTGIQRYVEETVEKVRRSGYVETIFGRRRYLPDLASRNRAVSSAAERAAINMPIQGAAADIVKRAMLELDRRLHGQKARMLLQVHDELLFEAPAGEAEQIAGLAREVMSSVAQLRVPLVVDVGTGSSWADAH